MAALPPPLSSLPPDYVSAYSGGPLRAVAIALTVLEILFVGLRFWSKSVGRVARGVDDWLIVGGLVCCLGLNAAALTALKTAGVGYHVIVIAETAPHKLITWAKFLLILTYPYCVGVALIKLSILVFYSRIFTIGWACYMTYAIMVFVALTMIATVLASSFQCIPLEYLWNKSIQGHCFDIVAFDRYGLLPQTISDVFMLLLPLPAIWSLHSPRRTRIGITLTFLTGSLGMIASIIRTVNFFNRDLLADSTWNGVAMWIWVIVEPGCYLIAACLVCMRPLFNLLTGRSTDGLGKQTIPFFDFRSIRSLFTSSRQDPVSADRSPPLHLDEIHSKSFPKLHIRIDRHLAQTTDEEALVGR